MKRWMGLLLMVLVAGCAGRGGRPDGSGTIECTEVNVAPLVGGRLLEGPPEEGTVLTNGALVAKIDATDYRMRVDEARAALAQAQAALDLMLAGSRAEDLQRAREEVRAAAAAATAAAADLRRIQDVYARGSATDKQRDESVAQAERTAALQAAAGEQLKRVEKGARVEEISAARAQMEVAKARLALAEKALADCTITSPLAGTVVVRNHEPGEVVPVGAALVTVARLDEVWLSLYIPETRLARVRLGQKAWVRLDGKGGTRLEGRVTFVAQESEFTPRNVQTPDERAKLVYRVKVTLPNPDGKLKPGMPADGFLE